LSSRTTRLKTGERPPRMANDDLNTLYAAWQKDKNPAVMDEMLKKLDGTVNSAIRSYASNDPIFKTRARLLAQEAIMTYDPKKAASVSTHVHNNLKRLYRISAERRGAIHVPENIRLDKLQIRAYMDEYKDQNGYDPDDIQVADALNMSRNRVKKALTGGEASFSEFESDKGDAPLLQKSDESKVWSDYVYYDLDPSGRKIMEWSWGYNGAKVKPVRDIAASLKVSPAAVSQRRTTILKRLNEIENLNVK